MSINDQQTRPKKPELSITSPAYTAFDTTALKPTGGNVVSDFRKATLQSSSRDASSSSVTLIRKVPADFNDAQDSYNYPLAMSKTPTYLQNFKFEYKGVAALFKESASDDEGFTNFKSGEKIENDSLKKRRASIDGSPSPRPRKRASVAYSDGNLATPKNESVLQDSNLLHFGGADQNNHRHHHSPATEANEMNVNENEMVDTPSDIDVSCPIHALHDENSPRFSVLLSPTDSTANGEQNEKQLPSFEILDKELTLDQIPNIINAFDNIPPQLKRYVLYNILRRCDRSTLSVMSGLIIPALRCDFLSLLPLELTYNILSYLDFRSLCQIAEVCKSWKRIVNSADWLWRNLLEQDGFTSDDRDIRLALNKNESKLKMNPPQSIPAKLVTSGQPTPAHTPGVPQGGSNNNETAVAPKVHKSIYKRKYLINKNWMDPDAKPNHIKIPGHGSDVVTCLQFDDDKIITGSDDHTINIYDTATGELRNTLEGHEGGVWALQYIGGNTLVSGSTDRTVRVWDIKEAKCTHVFAGHTSTVRCLDVLQPVSITDPISGVTRYAPEYPVIITGSRDTTLRIWKLPQPGDPTYTEEDISAAMVDGHSPQNPFYERTLIGHTHNVRAISGYGDTVVSGSYDTTVRVWKVSTGECQWELTGHVQRVYSAVIDSKRNRCISGSMDWFVKVWCLETGTLLYTLEGHTSLVGLIDLNRTTLVSAAADSTLRVWNPDTGEFLHKLQGHVGAITCFQHDEHKVVSGSEKTLKLWNIRTGQLVRDLLSDLSRIWQVRFDHRRCVAAVQRGDETLIEVLDFDTESAGKCI